MLTADELARGVAEVETLDQDVVPLAREPDARAGEGAGVVDFTDADHALVAGVERLADRRGGAQDVDHDPERGRDLLAWAKPSIGTSSVGYIEFTSPSSSDSVLAVREGKTVFTILTIPEINFVSLEHLAQKVMPLVRT